MRKLQLFHKMSYSEVISKFAAVVWFKTQESHNQICGLMPTNLDHCSHSKKSKWACKSNRQACSITTTIGHSRVPGYSRYFMALKIRGFMFHACLEFSLTVFCSKIWVQSPCHMTQACQTWSQLWKIEKKNMKNVITNFINTNTI